MYDYTIIKFECKAERCDHKSNIHYSVKEKRGATTSMSYPLPDLACALYLILKEAPGSLEIKFAADSPNESLTPSDYEKKLVDLIMERVNARGLLAKV